jgi:hypothetical protein
MRLKKKQHPISVPYTEGDLFAVQIAPNVWGYCRMRVGMGIEIPLIYTTCPGLPKVDWRSQELRKSLFYFFGEVREGDPVVVPVSNVAFASREEAEMPPTYLDPDAMEPRYTIEEKGIYRYTDDPADLKGILKQVTLIYATMGAFLKEQYHAGSLVQVDLVKSTEKPGEPHPSTDENHISADLHFVYAKILEAIDPLDRGDKYEDPLQEMLDAEGLGEVTGGGTMQEKSGKVGFVGIDIELTDLSRGIPLVARMLQQLGAPPGSTLEYELDGQSISHPIGDPAAG